jgi:flavin-dependent dehydrogenase
MRDVWDVVILGGGLAGLSLTRQLLREHPALHVLVIEKRPHPVREAAFKVGESSVEIGAHYFSRILDLDEHLRTRQLPKLGLRYFFPHNGNHDLQRRVELGPARFPRIPSFQLDRGRFENMLLDAARDIGATVIDGAAVRDLEIGGDLHGVTFEANGERVTVRTRWIADASGRAGLVKRKLNLARESTHGANASWFRVKAQLKLDDWVADADWRGRVPTGERWLSTNHLMGKGYWVWLIPLGSGSTSVGIVADGDLHPYNTINRIDRAMAWLETHEPQCAKVVAQHLDEVEDFLALKHYAHSCARVFSKDRWMLTGEAGVFTDPFYSPGSDFIAMGNDCITDVIVRERRGEHVDDRIEAFNASYLRLFEGFIRVYDGQYRLMGNAQVMSAKATWDNGCYWAVPALIYFQRRLTDPAFMSSVEALMKRFFVLHARMQAFFRAWDLADERQYADHALNVLDAPFLRQWQDALDAPLDDDALRARLEANVDVLQGVARAWQDLAKRDYPELPTFVEPGASAEDFARIEPHIVPATVTA